jgi:hypothetical protein
MTVLKYRCRRCQTVFDGQTLTSEAVIPTLRAIVTPEPGEPLSKSEALMAIHSCGTYEFGVADLIGADVEFTAASSAEEASSAEAVSSAEELQRILPSDLPTL